jgi:hypothetical protein
VALLPQTFSSIGTLYSRSVKTIVACRPANGGTVYLVVGAACAQVGPTPYKTAALWRLRIEE